MRHATVHLAFFCALAAIFALAGGAAFDRAQTRQSSQQSPQRPSAPAPTFARDVAPILYGSCASCHHAGGSAPFPLTSFEDAKSHAARIATAVRSREMPPWLPEPGYGDFVDDRRLTADQIRLIADWVRAAAPEGPASEEPTPPSFAEGWQLGPPDMIVEAARAYTIPATGPDVFWNFIFSPPVTTTRYVRAIEIHPGDTRLIHHANIIVDPARSARRQEKEPGAGFPGMDLKIVRSAFDIDSHFLFWKPGNIPWSEPDGLSWTLNPGDDLVLNAHMMTSGKPREVKPSIGLYFTDKPPAKFPILVQLENDDALNIPPGDPDFVVGDDFKLPLDVDVLAVYPHAHYLGHIVEGFATLPNGTHKQLIRINHWDPKWQAVYHYREPVFLPKGTVISMRWHYDNSAANPHNPSHPPRRVRSGDQSTDEMAHLSFQLLPRGNGDLRREMEEAVMRHRLEKHPDDYQAHIWLGALMLSRLNPAGAVDILDEAVRIDPKKPEGHDWLGVALISVGRSGEAIREFRAALAIQPDYTNARYNLAKALVRAGQLNEAQQDFSLVVAAFPANGQIRNEYGELLMRMGKPADALEQFDAALKVNPSDELAKKNRDLASSQLGSH
jgi:Tfp pilus assembly protein PilF/mono/diheme cytochrome c family protein